MRTRVALVVVAAGLAVTVLFGAAAARNGGGPDDPSVDQGTLKMGTPITYEQFKEPFPVPVPSSPGEVIGGPTEVIGQYTSGWTRP